VVNRIAKFFRPPTSDSLPGQSKIRQQRDAGIDWAGLMEDQIRQRPKIWLGVAFAVGVAVAWWIKRK
jgi:hypothetical protein